VVVPKVFGGINQGTVSVSPRQREVPEVGTWAIQARGDMSAGLGPSINPEQVATVRRRLV
jgi:hypothetical protein